MVSFEQGACPRFGSPAPSLAAPRSPEPVGAHACLTGRPGLTHPCVHNYLTTLHSRRSAMAERPLRQDGIQASRVFPIWKESWEETRAETTTLDKKRNQGHGCFYAVCLFSSIGWMHLLALLHSHSVSVAMIECVTVAHYAVNCSQVGGVYTSNTS